MLNKKQKAHLAKLEEEKLLLWTIIEDLEKWMFGEGCFISERTKSKIEIARKIMANQPLKFKRNTDFWTPEKRKDAADRSRKIITEYWAAKKKQPVSTRESVG